MNQNILNKFQKTYKKIIDIMKKLCIIKLEKAKRKVCCQEQNKPFVLGKSRMVYFLLPM